MRHKSNPSLIVERGFPSSAPFPALYQVVAIRAARIAATTGLGGLLSAMVKMLHLLSQWRHSAPIGASYQGSPA
jgi:hypothetical protein